jgi:hypothetical protein
MKRRATTAFCPPDRLLSDLVTAVPVKETLTDSPAIGQTFTLVRDQSRQLLSKGKILPDRLTWILSPCSKILLGPEMKGTMVQSPNVFRDFGV